MSLPPDDQMPAISRLRQRDMKCDGRWCGDWIEEDDPGTAPHGYGGLRDCVAPVSVVGVDDGATVHLKAGDCLCKTARVTKWFNRGKVRPWSGSCWSRSSPQTVRKTVDDLQRLVAIDEVGG